MEGSHTEITQMLQSWGRGDESAMDRLIELVYPELHRRAHHLFWQERRFQTLQPTALVNEAYLRLIDEKTTNWQSRSHFYRVATREMRLRLIDHARRRLAQKRGGGSAPEPLDEVLPRAAADIERDLVALNDALDDLRRLDPRQHQVVELRYFGGLSIQETANALCCSPATVSREWRSARVWLRLQIRRDCQSDDSRRMETNQSRL